MLNHEEQSLAPRECVCSSLSPTVSFVSLIAHIFHFVVIALLCINASIFAIDVIVRSIREIINASIFAIDVIVRSNREIIQGM